MKWKWNSFTLTWGTFLHLHMCFHLNLHATCTSLFIYTYVSREFWQCIGHVNGEGFAKSWSCCAPYVPTIAINMVNGELQVNSHTRPSFPFFFQVSMFSGYKGIKFLLLVLLFCFLGASAEGIIVSGDLRSATCLLTIVFALSHELHKLPFMVLLPFNVFYCAQCQP